MQRRNRQDERQMKREEMTVTTGKQLCWAGLGCISYPSKGPSVAGGCTPAGLFSSTLCFLPRVKQRKPCLYDTEQLNFGVVAVSTLGRQRLPRVQKDTQPIPKNCQSGIDSGLLGRYGQSHGRIFVLGLPYPLRALFPNRASRRIPADGNALVSCR